MKFIGVLRVVAYLCRAMNKRTRKNENIVYGALWLIVAAIYLFSKMRIRAQLSEPVVDASTLGMMCATLLPYAAVFVINNYLLIPKLLLHNHITRYVCAMAALMIVLWTYLYVGFTEFGPMPHKPLPGPGGSGVPPRPFLPLPLFLDCIYGLLLVGCNTAIALIFQRFDDKLEHESLMKANAQTELDYLKAQINPHFYMNMLNNIHGMIEIDPEKAQAMVLEMSRLMRYMLYESSKPSISLSEEVAFLNNYIDLMRQRFSADKVTITTRFPSEDESKGVMLPPLLFLIFIENAFKHGISYRTKSFVDVAVEIAGGNVVLRCSNSINAASAEVSGKPGIGLRNIKHRLSLLFGDRAKLTIGDSSEKFTVNLIIPWKDVKNVDN